MLQDLVLPAIVPALILMIAVVLGSARRGGSPGIKRIVPILVAIPVLTIGTSVVVSWADSVSSAVTTLGLALATTVLIIANFRKARGNG